MAKIANPIDFTADPYGNIKRMMAAIPDNSFKRVFISDPIGRTVVTNQGGVLAQIIERSRALTKRGTDRVRDLYNVYKANAPDPKDYKAFKSWWNKADDAFRPAINQSKDLVKQVKSRVVGGAGGAAGAAGGAEGITMKGSSAATYGGSSAATTAGEEAAEKTGKAASRSWGYMSPLELGLGILVDAAFLGLEGWEASQNVEQSEQQAMLESMRNPQAMAQDKFAQVLMQEMGMPGGVAQQAPPAQAPAGPSNAQQAQQALAAVMGAQQSSGLASGETVIGE